MNEDVQPTCPPASPLPHPHPWFDRRLVVLTGVGRSGTNILRRALSLHPQLHSTGHENNIIRDVLDVARMNLVMQSRAFALRVTEPAYLGLFRNLLLDLLWPRAGVAPAPRPRVNRHAAAYAEPAEPTAAGLPFAFTSLNIESARFLLRVFPQAHILLIVRNGIEVVASRMRHRSFADRPFAEHCERWTEAAELALAALSDDPLLRPAMIVIRHEHLITAETAEAAMARVWEALSIPRHEACMRTLLDGPLVNTPAESTEPAPLVQPSSVLTTQVVNASGGPAGAASPTNPGPNGSAGDSRPGADHGSILSTRIDRWREWTPEQQEIFAAHCGSAMERLGYRVPFAASR